MSDHGFASILEEWEKNLQKKEDKPRKVGSDFGSMLDAFEPKAKDIRDLPLNSEERKEKSLVSPQKLLIQDVLDLHGMTVLQAEAAVRSFAVQSKSAGYRKVLIIHGKGNHTKEGDGVLKSWLSRFLETQLWAGARGKADREHGGSGATWVVIKT